MEGDEVTDEPRKFPLHCPQYEGMVPIDSRMALPISAAWHAWMHDAWPSFPKDEHTLVFGRWDKDWKYTEDPFETYYIAKLVYQDFSNPKYPEWCQDVPNRVDLHIGRMDPALNDSDTCSTEWDGVYEITQTEDRLEFRYPYGKGFVGRFPFILQDGLASDGCIKSVYRRLNLDTRTKDRQINPLTDRKPLRGQTTIGDFQ